MTKSGAVGCLMTVFLCLVFCPGAGAMYNDYNVNKPSAFRDHLQVMIWDSEIYAAVEGFEGEFMFSTGSCFSGGFVEDLTRLARAAVVTANVWHGFGLSMCDFLEGVQDERAFHDDYMEAFRWDGTGFPPTFQDAYNNATWTVRTTSGQDWSWGGVEFPQFGASGAAANGTLLYKAGDRAILFSGMWSGNPYYLSSWQNTIVAGRELLMSDYLWPAQDIVTLFSDGNPPPGETASWLTGAGSKENLLGALRDAAGTLGPGNTLVVFVIAHGRSSAVMASRLLEDGRTIEYLLIPNGRSIARDQRYPAASYGSTQVEWTGFQDLEPSHYRASLPGSLPNWGWRIDPQSGSLFLESKNPEDPATWLEPGREYRIKLQYLAGEAPIKTVQGGWTLWLPEGGGGPPFMSDYGKPGPGWGIGEHVPGGAALGSPDPSRWGGGWGSGGDGWVLAPSAASMPVPALSGWGYPALALILLWAGRRRVRRKG